MTKSATNYSQTGAHPGSTVCDLCGNVIPGAQASIQPENKYNCCQSLTCQVALSRLLSMPEASHATLLNSYKSSLADMEAARDYKKHIRQKTSEQNQEIIKNLLKEQKNKSSSPPHHLVLPTGRVNLTSVPAARVERYKAFLKEKITEAFKLEANSIPVKDKNLKAFSNQPNQDILFDQYPQLKTNCESLCATCKGSCCDGAGDEAHITSFSLKRQIEKHNGITAEDLLDMYISRVPEKSVENACINKVEHGCTLPRSLRADICNYHYCQPLTKLQEKVKAGGDESEVIAIQRKGSLSRQLEATKIMSVEQVLWLANGAVVAKIRPEELDL